MIMSCCPASSADPEIQPMLNATQNTNLLDNDMVFAMQFIAGLNPMSIVKVNAIDHGTAMSENDRIRAIPREFNVSAVDKYLSSIDRNDSVSSLIAGNRLYMVDYHIVDAVPRRGGTVLYAPIVLLWTRTNGNNTHLMPLAIQLTRYSTAGKVNLVFTSASAGSLWKFAKMHVLHVDSVVHEAVVHLGYTHLVLEPIIIAFMRRLGSSHLCSFLERHFKDTIQINSLGRETLLKNNGQFDTIVSLGLNVSKHLTSAPEPKLSSLD